MTFSKDPGIDETEETVDETLGAADATDTAEETGGAVNEGEEPPREEDHGVALSESPEEAVKRLKDELEAAQDRYLRIAAEYDNYRRRSAKERLELTARAQGAIVAKLLDAFDDLGRVAHVDVEQAQVEHVLEGVQLVERKILRELESAGLETITGSGDPFDPNLHEAVGMVPTEDHEQDHTVADVFQVGYRMDGMLLRPARVRVYTFQEPQTEGDGAD